MAPYKRRKGEGYDHQCGGGLPVDGFHRRG
jgi:hypothetical protein